MTIFNRRQGFTFILLIAAALLIATIVAAFASSADAGTCIPGDLNGQEGVDGDDIIYLIEYIYVGGPAPVGCDFMMNEGDFIIQADTFHYMYRFNLTITDSLIRIEDKWTVVESVFVTHGKIRRAQLEGKMISDTVTVGFCDLPFLFPEPDSGVTVPPDTGVGVGVTVGGGQ